MSGEEGSIAALIAEVVRVGQLSQVSVQKHNNLLNLRDKSEDIANFIKLSPEAILLRYFPPPPSTRPSFFIIFFCFPFCAIRVCIFY